MCLLHRHGIRASIIRSKKCLSELIFWAVILLSDDIFLENYLTDDAMPYYTRASREEKLQAQNKHITCSRSPSCGGELLFISLAKG